MYYYKKKFAKYRKRIIKYARLAIIAVVFIIMVAFATPISIIDEIKEPPTIIEKKNGGSDDYAYQKISDWIDSKQRLNKYGFYYNVPYSVEMDGATAAYVFVRGGTAELYIDDRYTKKMTATYAEGSISINTDGEDSVTMHLADDGSTITAENIVYTADMTKGAYHGVYFEKKYILAEDESSSVVFYRDGSNEKFINEESAEKNDVGSVVYDDHAIAFADETKPSLSVSINGRFLYLPDGTVIAAEESIVHGLYYGCKYVLSSDPNQALVFFEDGSAALMYNEGVESRKPAETYIYRFGSVTESDRNKLVYVVSMDGYSLYDASKNLIATYDGYGVVEHICSYTMENTDVKFLASAATFWDRAEYYYSCACGNVGTDSFLGGFLCEDKRHDFVENVCTICGSRIVDASATPEAGLYEEGSNYTILHRTWDEMIAEGVLNDDGSNALVEEINTKKKNWHASEALRGDLVIPGTIKNIVPKAFFACTRLNSVLVGEGITSIGEHAFDVCSGLTSVTIPNGVTSIGRDAFSCCTSLTSITIPASVVSIDNYVFWGCHELAEIKVAAGNKVYHSDGNCLIETESKTVVAGCKTSVIPTDGSVTAIGKFAFNACKGLKSIEIPSNITSIGEGAFSSCSGLENITIPNSVTSISNGVFRNCANLKNVNLHDGVTSIGASAFDNCTSLESITIPTKVVSIGDQTFSSCINLTSVTIPEGVTSIGSSAFFGCTGLTRIDIPYGVLSIGNSAFAGCTNLANIKIPNSVTSVGFSAFKDCSNLITVNGGVHYVDGWAVDSDHTVKNVNIREKTRGISDAAFSGRVELKSVTIPTSVSFIGKSIFSGCCELIKIRVTAGNKVYRSDGNCLIEIESKTLVAGCKASVIPSNGRVTSIGETAFDGCSGLTSITIPNNVISIGYGAFRNCVNLTNINYSGKTEQWKNDIEFGYYWNENAGEYTVVCSDGTVARN